MGYVTEAMRRERVEESRRRNEKRQREAEHRASVGLAKKNNEARRQAAEQKTVGKVTKLGTGGPTATFSAPDADAFGSAPKPTITGIDATTANFFNLVNAAGGNAPKVTNEAQSGAWVLEPQKPAEDETPWLLRQGWQLGANGRGQFTPSVLGGKFQLPQEAGKTASERTPAQFVVDVGGAAQAQREAQAHDPILSKTYAEATPQERTEAYGVVKASQTPGGTGIDYMQGQIDDIKNNTFLPQEEKDRRISGLLNQIYDERNKIASAKNLLNDTRGKELEALKPSERATLYREELPALQNEIDQAISGINEQEYQDFVTNTKGLGMKYDVGTKVLGKSRLIDVTEDMDAQTADMATRLYFAGRQDLLERLYDANRKHRGYVADAEEKTLAAWDKATASAQDIAALDGKLQTGHTAEELEKIIADANETLKGDATWYERTEARTTIKEAEKELQFLQSYGFYRKGIEQSAAIEQEAEALKQSDPQAFAQMVAQGEKTDAYQSVFKKYYDIDVEKVRLLEDELRGVQYQIGVVAQPGGDYTRDPEYLRLINRQEELERQIEEENIAGSMGTLLDEDARQDLAYAAMTLDEAGLESYMMYLQRDLNKAATEEILAQNAAFFGGDNPTAGQRVGAGAWSAISSIGNVDAYFANAAQAVKNAVTGEYEPVDTYSAPFMPVRQSQQGRQIATQGLEEWQAFLANTGIAALQMALSLPLGPAGGSAMMGSSVAGDATFQALERGATEEEAFAYGTIYGGASMALDRIGLDNLFNGSRAFADMDQKSIKALFSTAAKNGVVESAEETGEEVVDILADICILRDKSEVAHYIQQYEAEHPGDDKNLAMAMYVLGRVGQSAAGGALAGFGFSLGANVPRALSDTMNYRAASSEMEGGLDHTYVNVGVMEGINRPSAVKADEILSQVTGVPFEVLQAQRAAEEGHIVPVDTQSVSAPDTRGGMVPKNVVEGSIAGENLAQGMTTGNVNKITYSENYTPEDIPRIRKEGKTFRNLIAGIDTTVSGFFDKWKNGRKSHAGDKLEKLYLGKTTDIANEDISNILGYDVDGRDFIITNDGVKHILNRHGAQGTATQQGSPEVTPEIIDMLPEIVRNPDDVIAGELGRDSRQGIIFKKILPNGTAVYVQFDNKGRGTLEGKTLYIEKDTTSMSNTSASRYPDHTSETTEPVSFSKINIPLGIQEVNTKNGAQQLTDTIIGPGETSENGFANAPFDSNVSPNETGVKMDTAKSADPAREFLRLVDRIHEQEANAAGANPGTRQAPDMGAAQDGDTGWLLRMFREMDAQKNGKGALPENTAAAQAADPAREFLKLVDRIHEQERAGTQDTSEADWFGKQRRKKKNKRLPGGVELTGYSEIPQYQEFTKQVKNCYPDARKILEKTLERADILLVGDEPSKYCVKDDYIQLSTNPPLSTLAHEAFHRYDMQNGISAQYRFGDVLRKEYKAMALSPGELRNYMRQAFPDAFEKNKRGVVYLKPEYRGISDILSGLTRNQLMLGYRHKNSYWGNTDIPLGLEAWAQMGRILYENNPKVIEMLRKLFPKFYAYAMMAIEEMK